MEVDAVRREVRIPAYVKVSQTEVIGSRDLGQRLTARVKGRAHRGYGAADLRSVDPTCPARRRDCPVHPV